MAWPTATDYAEAVQDLRGCMNDEELRGGQVVRSPIGLPMLWSGTFADVYKIQCPATGNTWALKCFTRAVPRQQECYRAIAAHLEQAKLPFTVDFQYQDQGIRINGERFPVLKMRWVEGLMLNQFVEEHVERPQNLKMLLDLWVKLAARLREAGIAHADLQHGNVILVPMNGGSLALRLIDYDGMYVPALARTRSGEVGLPAYQHPQRIREGTYNADVDRFSHLVIYTAIRCLIVGRTELWQRFNTGENLLFRKQDFQAPERSELFRTLWKTSDPSIRGLVGHLALACKQPLEEAPWVDQIIYGGQVHGLTQKEEGRVAEMLADRKATATKTPPLSPGEVPGPLTQLARWMANGLSVPLSPGEVPGPLTVRSAPPPAPSTISPPIEDDLAFLKAPAIAPRTVEYPMADFDPYYQWLAIPPKDQPPNHYRLLGVELFESNADVISHAADKQMAHVRSFQTGKYSAFSQKLLNEIAAAKVCLLNPAKKDAYDETLRRSQKSSFSQPPLPPSLPAQEQSPLQFRSAPQPSDNLVSDLSFLHKPVEKKPTKTRAKTDWLPAMVALALFVIAIGAVTFVLTRQVPKPEEVAQVEPKKAVQSAPSQPPAIPQQPKPQLVQPVPEEVLDVYEAPQQPKPQPVQPVPEEALDVYEAPQQPKPRPVQPVPLTPIVPKPEPAVQPKPEPKVEAKPEPKVEPTPDPTPAQKKKLAVPDEATQKQALASIRAAYKNEYRDKTTLAKKLLKKADENKNDLPTRFVLLQEAQRVAIETGQGTLAFDLIDLMASEFNVNGPEMKAGILGELAKKDRLISDQSAIAEAAFEVMDEALRNDDFSTAKRIGKLISQVSRKAKDKDLIQDIQQKTKDVDEYEKAFHDLSDDDKNAKRPLGRKSWISRKALYTVSSNESADKPPLASLLSGENKLWNNRYAFLTNPNDNPFIVIDLQKRYYVKRIVIESRDRGGGVRPGEGGPKFAMWLSNYAMPRSGVQVWESEKPLSPNEINWRINVPPTQCRYITIGVSGWQALFFGHIWIYGH